MVEQDSNTQGDGANEPAPYVTADVAWEMSKRAAAEARAEALKESQLQMQNSRNAQSGMDFQNNRDAQNNRDVQNNRDAQNNRDHRNDRDARNNRNDRDDDYDDRRVKKRRTRDDEEEEEDLVGFSPKLIKQLQTTVGVFNTLKDFASNPMQKAIEDRIGGLAAGIIENAFSAPRGPPPKRDMVDTFLNSQMAFGIGQGLGSRAPELVETLSKSFGKEKAEGMIDGMIGKYSGGGGGQRKIESGERDREEPSESDRQPARPSPMPQKAEDQSNIELLLSLDPNNPEHVAAYAESQGGISIDVARKMLMIHQDDIIKRMKSQGADTTVIESQRGSRIGQDNPPQKHTTDEDTTPISEPRTNNPIHKADVTSDYPTPPVSQRNVSQPPPVQQVPHSPQPPPTQRAVPVEQMSPISQPPPIQRERPINVQQESVTQEDMGHMGPSQEDTYDNYQDRDQGQDQDQEYIEYKDVEKDKPQEKNINQNVSSNQQAEMMKAFADDIGKVMGDVIGKIEGLNNTVFSLQSELNEIKKQKTQPVPSQPFEQIPLQQKVPTQEFFPEGIPETRHNISQFPEEINEHKDIQDRHIRDSFPEEIDEHKDVQDRHIRDSFPEEIDENSNIQGSFPEEIDENSHIHDSFPTRRREPTSTKDFFPDDLERESEKSEQYTQNAEEPKQRAIHLDEPKQKTKDVEEQKPRTKDVEKQKPKIQDFSNFFPEKVQSAQDFEKELEEETRHVTQSTKATNVDDVQDATVDNKEIETAKKPIISIVSKKRVSYLPKQKGDGIKSGNKGEMTNDKKDSIENSASHTNSEINNADNGENGENDKDNVSNNSDKDNTE